MAGSVVATEEPLALIAFGVTQGEYRKALLVLAPRKPERFEAAAAFITESQRKYVKRSSLHVPMPSGQTTSGSETQIPDDVTSACCWTASASLASLYRLADGVFVGGSLVESGGHNILEPAAFGKVPVFGDSMENFAEIAERFVTARGGAAGGQSRKMLASRGLNCLRNPERNKKMGETARTLGGGEPWSDGPRGEAIRRNLASGQKST